MASNPRRLDHWTASLDAVEQLRARVAKAGRRPEDPQTRQLMAAVAHAKSSSFIALLDVGGHVLDVNPAALIAGGLDRTEVIGLQLWRTPWWDRGADEAVESVERAFASAAQGRFARFDVEVMIEGAGREIGTLDLLLRPLRGRDGQVAFVVAEGRVITDRKRVEQRLEQQNAELSALTERLARVHDYRERLLGEISHDLRAPLQVVITRTEQVLRAVPHNEPISSQMVNIRLAALGALEQIDDMLEQVRADHGEASLTLVEADLADAVRAVAAQFEPLAHDRGIELELVLPARLAARFDVERVSRIVSNLMANAMRHTPPEGRVRCELESGDRAALLQIADSGPGVPAEHRDAVFGRYRSGLEGDGRSDSVGAGLGLAIVREFVELHGGEIMLGDAPEGGALFTVALPLRPPSGTESSPTLSQMAAAAQRIEYVRSHLEAEFAPPALPVRTVVIVERVPGRAETIVDALGESAVTCVAEDAPEALRIARELLPHAVVVGTSTGDMAPASLLRRLAADPRLVDVRRVALAGEREQDASPEALVAAGAQLVLPAGGAEELADRLWSAASPIRP